MSVRMIYQDNLKIVTFNANSLVSHSKRVQLSQMLQEHNPDIALICETKLNSGHRPRFPGYDFIRNDRVKNEGGGTGILIRSSFNYESVNSPGDLSKMEITLIKVFVNDERSIFCGAIYQVSFSSDDLERILSLIGFGNVNQSYVLGGDWNCRHVQWFNPKNNPNGVKLKRWLDDRAETFRTRMLHSLVPTHSDSFIDFFLVHQRLKVSFPPGHCDQYLEAFEPGMSDHKAVELMVNLKSGGTNRPYIHRAESKSMFSFKSADWDLFRKSLDDQLSCYSIPDDRNVSEDEIDSSLSSLSGMILEAMNGSIPKFTAGNAKQVDLSPMVKSILNRKRCLSAKFDRAFVSTGSKQSPRCRQIKSEVNCLEVMYR